MSRQLEENASSTLKDAYEHPLVSVSDLVVRFPVKTRTGRQFVVPVNKVNFHINKGEVLALVGESGSGKTTIGRALVRTLEPNSGRIDVDGSDISHIRGRELEAYRSVAQMIFQDPFGSLNPVKTVARHLQFPVHKLNGKNGQELADEVDDLLLRVGLTPVPEMREKFPHELSGGQRQRLAIARALAVQPKLVIADEPISMLDVSIRAGILKLLNQLRDDLGLSYLYITHDLASARYFGDRIMVLYGGQVMETADSAQLIRNPQHPYTRLLLAATPGSSVGGALPEKSNEPPNLLETRRGCPFAPRCPLASDVCSTMPELSQTEDRHKVACHHI
jgi:peptide/nickel transport system ATP-binding protein